MVTKTDDMQLLRDYAARDSQEAFSTLVSRYINLVYSVAFRQTGNQHEAEEVAQAVFVVLARKANSLRPGTILSGWLYETARLTAANSRRSEIRRHNREQQAYMQSTLNDAAPEQWERVGPLIEQAMSGLNEADRNAIVLRYFENKPLRDVGAALGSSEDAAKMRVTRALEKLRVYFQKRGITLSAAALGAAISAHSVQAAPVGLSSAVIAAACQGTALTASTLTLAKGTLKLMAWTKLSFIAGTAAVAVITLQWVKIESQQNETVALQKQVQQITQQSEHQLATIKEFQQGGATRRAGFSQPLTGNGFGRPDGGAAFARAAAAKPTNPTGAAATDKSMGGMMQSMMKDPAMLKAMTDQQAAMLKVQYASLLKQLKLTPDQRDAFFAILASNQSNNMVQGLAMMNGTNSADTTSAIAAGIKTMQDQMHELLGDPSYAQFQDFQSTLPDRQILEQYKGSFGDHPLTSDQEQQLLQLMVAERKNVGTPIDPNTGQPMLINPGDKIAAAQQSLQVQEQINQRVFEQAGTFLSPDQMQALGTSQTNLFGMMKAVIPFETKMLGRDAGGQ
jgi:RNA polymerase sigma factor (sigma-70 family)